MKRNFWNPAIAHHWNWQRSTSANLFAFPLISSGIYGYPKDQALKVAVDTIQDFLMEQELQVYLVIFDRNSYQISEKLFDDIASYIDDSLCRRTC